MNGTVQQHMKNGHYKQIFQSSSSKMDGLDKYKKKILTKQQKGKIKQYLESTLCIYELSIPTMESLFNIKRF